MTTQTEALKLSLEALDRIDLWLKTRYSGIGLVGVELEAITAIKEALAQTEQEPVAITITGKLGNIYSFTGDYSLKKGDKVYTTPPQPQSEARGLSQSKSLTEREIELIDGMIEVQLHHAAQCDRIANRPMAEKQKGWDMERVQLLRKLKSAHGIKGDA